MAFEIVHFSVWVFVISSFVSLFVMGKLAPNRLDSMVSFIPPVIPAGAFAAWMLRRVKSKLEKHDT